jgi:CheY-like chemotaxis protein
MPKTLLLADDSVTIQKVVGISFANEDVVLVTVDNGDDAIAQARDVRPDLVLADIMMPGRDGYDVCDAIKSDPELRHVPVLLLSGTFESYDDERAARVGADGHITKPFEAQVLVDTVNELLARSSAPPATGHAAVVVAAAAEPDDAEAFDFFDEELSPTAPAPAPTAAAPPALVADPEELAFAGEGFELEAAVEDEDAFGTEALAEPVAIGSLARADAGQTTVAILDPDHEAPSPEAEIDAPLPFFGEEFDEDSLVASERAPAAGSPAPERYEESFEFGLDADAADDGALTVALFDLPAGAPPAAAPRDPAAASVPPPVPASLRFESAAAALGAQPALRDAMRQQLHDTLEKAAWEAFGDLSERIVRETLERIEAVAWEVIPQMAEALIREEIRRLQGSED